MSPCEFLRRYGRQSQVISFLIIIVLAPRMIAGELYLQQAKQFETQNAYLEASLSYQDSANRLWWKKGLFERSARAAKLGGDDQAALVQYLHALAQDGLTPLGKLELGDLIFASRDYQQAIDLWGEIDRGFPESLDAMVRIAHTNQLVGNTQKAIVNWQEVLEIDQENDEAHYNLGLLWMITQPQKAFPELMKAADLNQDWDGKVQVLREGLNLAMLNDYLPYQLMVAGRSLASIDEWKLAQVAFLNATTLSNDYPEAWAWLGEAYQHTGNDGLPALKKALEMDNNSPIILALNGLYYRRNNQIDDAWSAYSQAARLEPTNPAWQLALGDLSAQKGELLEAREFYEKAVSLGPSDPEVWRGIATFYTQYDMEVTTLGLRSTLQLLKLAPNDWRSYNLMGQVLMARGDLDSAKLFFKKALNITSDQAEIYLHLGYLLLMQNQRDEAYTHLINAHQLDQEGSIGWQAQRLLDQYFP